jgi:hypothetical protein
LKEEKISMDQLKLLEELLYSKNYENKGKFYNESKKYVKEANWNEQFEVYNFVVKNIFLNFLEIGFDYLSFESFTTLWRDWRIFIFI